MELRFTQAFNREFKKITRGNVALKKRVIKQLQILLKNPKHPSLRLHKLEGIKYWSISISKSIRVLILFAKEAIYIYHIGKHEDVY